MKNGVNAAFLSAGINADADFLAWTSGLIKPKAMVQTARYGPRKRSAGTPRITPKSAANAVPATMQSVKSILNFHIRIAAVYAPTAKSPAWPAETSPE